MLQFVFGENLHQVVNVQQDTIQVDAVDGLREETDHPPQTLNTHTSEYMWVNKVIRLIM